MPTVVTDAHKSALSKAKIALMGRRDSAFFTTLCFSMKFVWDDTIPTACTNGLEIRINPEFFLGLSVEERVFVLVHETCHPAYQHMTRIEDYGWDPRKGNIAGDHVINLQLKERGFAVPKWVLQDPQYTGMSMEKVYRLLPNPPPNGGGGAGLDGDIQFGPPKTAEEKKKLQRQIEDILVRAKLQSQISKDKPGTIPGEIEVFIDGLLNPKLPWYRILQKWLQSFDKNDHSWRKPNRRFFPKYHLPSLWSEALIDLACFTDISGSVTDDMYKVYVGETCSLLRMMKPKKMIFGQFDDVVQSIHEIRTPQELLKVRFHGRGGTSIGPVLDWLNENKPEAAVIFSDGAFHFYEGQETKVPVIWIVHDNPDFSPPFGKVVHFEM